MRSSSDITFLEVIDIKIAATVSRYLLDFLLPDEPNS
jgi:hypothetical protein